MSEHQDKDAGPVFLSPGKLVVLSSKLHVHRLNKTRIVLGSVVSADVRLTGDGIAPIHAVLEINEKASEATVYDLASPTGVFVNGKKVVTDKLKSGDSLTIGTYTLKISLEEASRGSASYSLPDGNELYVGRDEDLAPLLLEDSHQAREIFDYRPSRKDALEVVMSWHGLILDVAHFVQPSQVTIGDRKTDFAIPPILGPKKFPLVSKKGGQLALNLDPKMRGVVQRQGKLQAVDELLNAPVALGREDFAKLSVGDVDFYLSFTAAPPRLKRSASGERDPLFTKIILSSLVMTTGLILALLNAKVPEQIEAEELPERIATILYQPEKFTARARPIPTRREEPQPEPEPEKKQAKPKPIPTAKLDLKPKKIDHKKPIPKEMNIGGGKPKAQAKSQDRSSEGQGAKARGHEGTRGSKTAKASSKNGPQHRATRPSPSGGRGRGNGNSRVADVGNLDLLKGAQNKILDLLGNSAAKLGPGGKKLKGFGGFTTLGNGGLALSGTGQGGGGTADSLGGLGKTGRAGGRIGTGLGAAGTGSGIIGGKTRVVIRSGGPEETLVMGAIDPDAVEAAIQAHRDSFRLCYEREINAETPNISGRVGTSFVIGSSGRVTQAGITSTSLGNANVERCIVSVIRRIEFPRPRGGVVEVKYPFKFTKPNA